MQDEWDKEHDRVEIDAQRRERDEERAGEHDARPDDLPEPGDRCKHCGLKITWIGPTQSDWEHVTAPIEELGKLTPVAVRSGPSEGVVDFDTEDGETVVSVYGQIKQDGTRVIVVDVLGDDVKVQVNR